MRTHFALAAVLTAASFVAPAADHGLPQSIESSDKGVDAMMCGPATEIFIPDTQRSVAPNVRLEHLQYASPDDPCGRNFDHDDVTKLHDRVKSIAVASFASSQASYGVMVKYTLASGGLPEFEMRTMDAPESELERLTTFHNRAKGVEGFHPTTGTVDVVMQYSIGPAPPSIRPDGG
jgi:hypothetical protein